MQFAGIMIGSDDPAALAAFYARFLGEPSVVDNTWYIWNPGAQIVIGAHSEVKGKSALPQRLILTFYVDDVRKTFDELKGLGAAVVAEPYRPAGDEDALIATVEDPDGNYLQFSPPWNP